MSPPSSISVEFVKAASFYTVDKEPVNTLFADERIIFDLGKVRGAYVAAEGLSSTAGMIGIVGAHDGRAVHRLIHITPRV